MVSVELNVPLHTGQRDLEEERVDTVVERANMDGK
jgi:hypothetical protein